MPPSHEAIASFVVQHLRGAHLAGDDDAGVPGSVLIQLCLHEFCAASHESQVEEYAGEDRQRIVSSIRRLNMEGVLRLRIVDGIRRFRLADDYEEEEDGLADGGSEEGVAGGGGGGGGEGCADVQGPFVQLGDLVESDPVDGNGDGDSGDYGTDEYYDTTAEFSRWEEGEEEEGGEEEEKGERPIRRKDWSDDTDFQPRSSQMESIERAPDTSPRPGHLEAYKTMTRGAAPLPQSVDQAVAQTPSRKRSRPREIVASDSSSSSDRISPQRYVNSTPKRSTKRIRSDTPGTPLSDSRRKSAPSKLNSPHKPTPRRLPSYPRVGSGSLEQSYQDGRPIVFKEEMKDTSLPFVHDIVINLREKHPRSSFIADDNKIRCLDCNRTFNAISKGFENHLRSKPHQQQVEKKEARQKCKESMSNGNLYPTKPKYLGKDLGMESAFQPQDIAVFANRVPQSTLASLRAQYFAAMENETHTYSVRMSLLEARQVTSDQRITESIEQLQKLEAEVKASNETVRETSYEIKMKVEASEDRICDKLKEVMDHLDQSQSKNDDQLLEIGSRVAKLDEECESKLGKMSERMARSDHRNLDYIDDLKAQVTNLGTEFDAYRAQLNAETTNFQGVDQRPKQLHSQLELRMNESGQMLTLVKEERAGTESNIRELEESHRVFKELRAQIESMISGSEAQRLQLESQFAQLEARAQESQVSYSEMISKVEGLERKAAESAEYRAQTESRMQELQQANARREDECHDLEAQSQLHTEELQRQRDSITEFKKTITDQVEENLQHAERCRQSAVKAALERERTFEEKMMGKFAALQQSCEAESQKAEKKTRSLKKKIQELEEDIDRITQGVPLIFHDIQEVKDYLGGFVRTINARVAGLKASIEGCIELKAVGGVGVDVGVSEARRGIAV
ncbi:uncharacterized protein L3040_002000 [Drepanopeziza brunnea f. sp. 'multigermtubi']|nr:hypothetical protein L3040_002000 [Drepanopeziza brunnea f. sp. 'multigermtubi']